MTLLEVIAGLLAITARARDLVASFRGKDPGRLDPPLDAESEADRQLKSHG